MISVNLVTLIVILILFIIGRKDLFWANHILTTGQIQSGLQRSMSISLFRFRQQRRGRWWRRQRERVPAAVPRLLGASRRGAVRPVAAARTAAELVLLRVPAAGRACAHLPVAIHAAAAVGCVRLAVPLVAAAGGGRRAADAGNETCCFYGTLLALINILRC